MNIHDKLLELADPAYLAFSSKLLPGITNMIGVRLPVLRKLAKEICKGSWELYLQQVTWETFEETMLTGMVIAALPLPLHEKWTYIEQFIPHIDNWSVCDSFCASLSCIKEDRQQALQYLQPYLSSKEEFPFRFAVVMLLWYYSDETYLPQTIETLVSLMPYGYYAEMAVAWALATCFATNPTFTLPYLQDARLSATVRRISIRKIRESAKIPAIWKQQAERS